MNGALVVVISAVAAVGVWMALYPPLQLVSATDGLVRVAGAAVAGGIGLWGAYRKIREYRTGGD